MRVVPFILVAVLTSIIPASSLRAQVSIANPYVSTEYRPSPEGFRHAFAFTLGEAPQTFYRASVEDTRGSRYLQLTGTVRVEHDRSTHYQLDTTRVRYDRLHVVAPFMSDRFSLTRLKERQNAPHTPRYSSYNINYRLLQW